MAISNEQSFRQVVASELLIKKFRHFNVAATDDTDEAGGTHFLVKEYVEATHLSAFSEEARDTFS